MTELFHPLISQWFHQNIGEPTAIQKLSWEEISKEKNVLLTAPTGSGKTLASFLWSINQLVTGAYDPAGISILYISPLKALNNDIHRNLTIPLQALEKLFKENSAQFPKIRLGIRSGDTPQSERQNTYKSPPQIFITTPESLHILLTSPRGRELLTGIKVVILDEIHAVLESRRGVLLTTAMERLCRINGEFQRIGLSATVEPLERAAQFLGGYLQQGDDGWLPRKVKQLRDPGDKKYTLKVINPPPSEGDEERWSRIAKQCLEIIETHNSVLFFTDSRRITEKAARLINDLAGEMLVWAHHGSLSRELRHQVEHRMKQGELKAIIATSSLELGIDIGSLDMVVMLQCPSNLSSAIQRIGRAGHNVGETSHSSLIPMFQGELLQTAALVKSLSNKQLEEIHPLKNPLDVLSQLILSITNQSTWKEDDLYNLLRGSWTYHELPRQYFDLTLDMLMGKYSQSNIKELEPRIIRDQLNGTVKAREKGSWLIYTSGGVIPDRGYFDLRLADSKVKIGELDEEFVWERNLGESFTLGNQIWRITAIKDSHVEVIPAEGIINIVPFWKAEDMNRSPLLSRAMGEILEQAESSQCSDQLVEKWQREFHFDESAAQELMDYLKMQREWTQAPLPSSSHILVEHCRDNGGGEITEQLIFHTLAGGAVNQPMAMALVQAWFDKTGVELPYFVNNDGFTLLTAGPVDPEVLLTLINGNNILDLLKKRLSITPFYGARFRECAGRAMLLPKKHPKGRVPLWLNRLRSRKILTALERYPDFPITLEAWRTSLEDHFDIPGLKELLLRLHSGELNWSQCNSEKPSPFAASLAWRQVNTHMYEDDTPMPSGTSNLSDTLLKELINSSQLRPQVPIELVIELENRLQRLKPGYGAETAEEAMLWLERRIIVPHEEWNSFINNSLIHFQKDEKELIDPWKDRFNSNEHFVYLEQNRGQVEDLLQNLNEDIFFNLLQYYGPRSLSFWRNLLGKENEIENMVNSLIQNGRILFDQMIQNSQENQICSLENLEYLLRMLRRSNQPALEPRELNDLPLFMAVHQGLISRGNGINDIQSLLDKIIAYPLPLALWEQCFFPSRMEWYNPKWLDEILVSSGLQWRGEKDKNISFIFPEETDLWTEEKDLTLEFSWNGQYDFFQLKSHWNMDSRETAEKIWNHVWQGLCSNSGFQVLRKAMHNKFKLPPQSPGEGVERRGHYGRWASQRPMEGYWFCTNQALKPNDELEEMERKKERVRQLLSRYPILARPLLRKEKKLMSWRELFPALRLMELSGELISGVFFKDLPYLQFAKSSTIKKWKELDLWKDNLWFLNAQDPASLCGSTIFGIHEHLPHRLPGNWLVYKGNKLMMTLEKKGEKIKALYDYDCEFNPHPFWEMLLTREEEPYKKIEVRFINEEKVLESPWKENFKAMGFEQMGKSLVLRRKF